MPVEDLYTTVQWNSPYAISPCYSMYIAKSMVTLLNEIIQTAGLHYTHTFNCVCIT